MKIITSPSNLVVKHTQKIASKKSYRKEQSLVYVESPTTIKELILAGLKLDSLLSTDPQLLKEFECANKYHITPDILKKISPSSSPQPIIALFHTPKQDKVKNKKIILCDRIRDPGNLGTLFRSALAFGYDSVWLIENCADPHNPKTIRASKGASLLIAHRQMSVDEAIELASKSNIQLISAQMRAPDYSCFKPKESFGIIIGNEASGVQQALEKIAAPLSIPMQPHCESLNAAVAGSILMHALNPIKKGTHGS